MKVNYIEPKKITSGLGVPYPKNESPSSQNIGYFDIKLFPEKMGLFPELKGWEQLKGLIVIANKPDGIFRTLRCDVTSSKLKRQRYKHKVTSYVTFAFEIIEWNKKENFHQLYKEFSLFAERQVVTEQNIVEFELVPTSYNDHSYNAWSVDVWNHGFGGNEKEAKANWLFGLRIIKEFIVDQNQKYGDQLLQDGRRIGDKIT